MSLQLSSQFKQFFPLLRIPSSKYLVKLSNDKIQSFHVILATNHLLAPVSLVKHSPKDSYQNPSVYLEALAPHTS